jgi:AbrB family looped-hinge helix DNA binding protein
MGTETRKVGRRGQVTIPKELRERFGIRGGDEVVVREEDGRIVIETASVAERLAEGYRERAERDAEIAEEMDAASREADAGLGDAPEW